eukprot:SAG22_NODE_331_length_12174_cov_12.920497_1_plen_175_part_10
MQHLPAVEVLQAQHHAADVEPCRRLAEPPRRRRADAVEQAAARAEVQQDGHQPVAGAAAAAGREREIGRPAQRLHHLELGERILARVGVLGGVDDLHRQPAAAAAAAAASPAARRRALDADGAHAAVGPPPELAALFDVGEPDVQPVQADLRRRRGRADPQAAAGRPLRLGGQPA